MAHPTLKHRDRPFKRSLTSLSCIFKPMVSSSTGRLTKWIVMKAVEQCAFSQYLSRAQFSGSVSLIVTCCNNSPHSITCRNLLQLAQKSKKEGAAPGRPVGPNTDTWALTKPYRPWYCWQNPLSLQAPYCLFFISWTLSFCYCWNLFSEGNLLQVFEEEMFYSFNKRISQVIQHLVLQDNV